jgi:prepilin-type N-terminal cleavage/methylation domain-containing protein
MTRRRVLKELFMAKFRIKKNRLLISGFTLIELLVATSLFVVVVTVVSGIFISTVNTQRKIIGMGNVQESASFILESMAKEIRMSVVDGTLLTGTPISELRIKVYKEGSYEYVTYKFDSDNLTRTAGADPTQAVNPSNIKVTGNFYIQNNSLPLRNKVTVRLHAESKNTRPTQKAEIDLQTSMTPRGPQNNY